MSTSLSGREPFVGVLSAKWFRCRSLAGSSQGCARALTSAQLPRGRRSFLCLFARVVGAYFSAYLRFLVRATGWKGKLKNQDCLAEECTIEPARLSATPRNGPYVTSLSSAKNVSKNKTVEVMSVADQRATQLDQKRLQIRAREP